MATTTKLVELFNADETIAALSTQAFVEAAYENLLGLSGDFSNKDARVAYWVAKIDAGLATADFAATFLAAAAVQGDLLTDAEFAANTAALAAVAALDETGLTLEAVKAAAVASAEPEVEEPSNPGETFTLTTGDDILTGTTGDDTFNGASGSIGADDILIDASTTDADVANLVVTGTTNPQFTAANIETVNMNFELAATADVTKVTGSEVVNVGVATAGNTAAELLGVGSAVKNIATSAEIATLTLRGTAAATDSVKVTVGKSAMDLVESTTNIESYEVATSGTASNVEVDWSATLATRTLTASGDADLTLTENAAGDFALDEVATLADSMDEGASLTVKSKSTGGDDYSNVASTATLNLSVATTGTTTLNNEQSLVKVSADGGGVTLAAKSGSANTLNLQLAADQTAALTLSGYSTLNLTASQTDGTALTLNGAGASSLSAAGVTVNYTGETDIELLGSANKWSAFNASEAAGSVTALLVSDANSLTGGAGNDHIDVATDISFTVAGGAGTDTLDIGAATIDFSDNDVQLSGVEVIDVSDATGTTQFAATQLTGQTLSFIGTTDAVTVNLVATGDTADLSNISQSGISTFTIAGGAGADSITGTKGADTITGGAGADTIVGGEGLDTITGGAGNDSIDLTEATANADIVVLSTASTNGQDSITGFAAGAGGDTINLTTTMGGAPLKTAIAANAAEVTVADTDVAVFADGADGMGEEAIADYTDMVDVAAFLAAGLNETGSETYAAVVNDLVNDKAYVYYVDVDSTGSTAGLIESGDITLLAVVDIANEAAFTTANIV